MLLRILLLLLLLPTLAHASQAPSIGETDGAGAAAAEVNNLETITTGIATTEIPIGTAVDTVIYAPLSGEATMDNAGVVTVAGTHSGSAHHAAITMSGANTYITLSGQDIVRGDVALTTHTSGNYVDDVTASQGLLLTGTEGATVGLQDCAANEVLKRNAGDTAWECAADATGGAPSFDLITTGTNTTAVMTVGTGGSMTTSGSGTITATTSAALAANGGNCSAGSYPLGVDDVGAVESCTDATTEIDSAISTHAAVTAAHQAEVSLAGTPDYITIVGQVITRNAVDLAADVTGTLPVGNGGTGATTFTDGGILIGNGSGAIQALGVATNGQIPIGDGTTDPVLAGILGTANEVEITNGAGTITVGIVTSPTLDGSNFTGIAAGAYDAASIDGDDINSNYAGSFLTQTAASPDTMDLDAEVTNHHKSASIIAPVDTDDAFVQMYFPSAVTITRVVCSTDVGTATIQFDERAEATPNTGGTDVMTGTLVCDATSEATTSFTNAGIAADVPLSMDVDAVATSPGVVRVHVEYTIDD